MLTATCLAAILLDGPARAQVSAGPRPNAALPAETAQPCDPSASAGQGPRILIRASGARRIAGNITFTLYGDRPEAFLAHRGSIAIDRVTLSAPFADACFAVSRPGIYAIAIYHDENDNHHFDRSLVGLPLEGYGFSDNPTIFLSAPSFAEVRFTAGPGDTRIGIRLHY